MIKKSIWINNYYNDIEDSLKENIECDILVIGGGIAGLSTSYYLKDSNKKVVLMDKDRIGYGTTSKNTGKLDYMQGLIYHKIEKNYNKDIASLYLKSQKEAINEVVKIIKKYKIDCHLKEVTSYAFSNDINDEKDFNKEIDFYKENNIEYKVESNLPIKYPSSIVLSTNGNYIFNPFEYMIGLKNIIKEKVKIYENTICTSIDKKDNYYICKIDDKYKIKAKYVVCTTHYPIFIVPFLIPFKTEVQNFYIGTFKENNTKNISILSYNKPVISMRYYDKYFLYGRRSHSSSTNLDISKDLECIKKEIKKYFNKDIEYFYHTNDIMTYDNLPFIGEISPHLYIATGFNKWGNTNGTISGKIISDLINNKDNKYIKLFNPKRSISLDKIKNIPLYNIKVGTRYLLNKINPHMDYYDGNVKIKFINGKRCGIYIDENKKEHIVSNICPHMKCYLIFNYVDKTWDCPCHGSRFTIDGDIIEGPSVYNIRIDSKKNSTFM